MTQQYIVGQFSALLGELEPSLGEWSAAVRHLRREVESSPLRQLPELARKGLQLTDAMCWAALEHGDVGGFYRSATAAGALWDFTRNARLLPE
jgi:hypothetical protein